MPIMSVKSPNRTNGHGWSIAASQYASTVGRPSTEAAGLVVEMANEMRPISSSSKVLDIGAGTGAVTMAIASRFPETSIAATDFSPAMLDTIKHNIASLPTAGSSVSMSVLDANAIRNAYEISTFTHVFSNFVLQTATLDPLDVVRQMHKVLEPNGVVGLGVWGPSPDPYKIVERATRTISPDFKFPEPFEDETAWRTPGELAAGMEKAGFVDLTTVFRRIPFPFDSGKAFAQFWFGAKNPGALKWVDAWNEESERVGRDPSILHDVTVQIVDTEWDGGADICVEVVMAVGRKP